MATSPMGELRLKQMQFEADAWKRLIGYLMSENVYLKNRLAEVLTQKFDIAMLEEIENFHTLFLKKDELIFILRHELAELDKLLVGEIFEDGAIIKKVTSKMNTLRKTISNAENQFSKMKLEFNNYLSDYL